MSGGETAQPLAEYYMDCWKEIGLDVKLSTGRLIEFQSFYDKLKMIHQMLMCTKQLGD